MDMSNLSLGFPISAAGQCWGWEVSGAFGWVICCDAIPGMVRDVTSSFLAVSQE